MRNMVVAMSADHKSSLEIEAFFKDKFGDEIIIDRADGDNYFLYLGPLFLGLLFALSLVPKSVWKTWRNSIGNS